MVFKTLDEGYETNRIHLSLYNQESQCLWITIPTGAHEILHTELYLEIRDRIRDMGLQDNWVDKGSTTFYGIGPCYNSGGGGGQGDSTGGPDPERLGFAAYPTLVVEAGHSHTLAELRTKATSWFSRSNHDVKIVVLVKLDLDLTQHTIIVERWEERQRGQSRQGATTRWAAEWIPGCQQTITITNPPVSQVTSSNLVLDFRLLFLRNPRQGGGDVIITTDDLQRYAQRIWRVLGA